MIDFAHYCKTKVDLIEKELKKIVEVKEAPYSTLFESAHYSLFSSGKRLRPLLLLAVVDALEKDMEAALQPACALEMIHTYSLIHDDLPCMDNDDFRRGKPTLHKMVPEWQALLTGDYLLTYAFEIVANAPLLTDTQKVKLVQLFSKSSGADGMIGGQVMDLSCKLATVEELKKLHSLKTGKLLTAAVLAGAIIAGVDECPDLDAFGEKIGLAFQIIDDVIDVTASEEKHGKKISSDQINNKTTYVSLMGVEGSKKAAEELLSSAKTHLRSVFKNPYLLELFAEKLVYRTI